ncbi:MAG: sigma-70 family RNA polymerase sigma factor [Gemmatimonadetes bacterium]|nr:sigma-70 family RNA polymerase sigma factor [Gemmatimonadota bacterium]
MVEFVDLVARAQAGDLEAYGVLVERFRKMALGYAEARLGDFHLAEDVAQEAFIHAYLAIGQLRSTEAFPGWLRQILSTYCGRQLRRSSRLVPSSEDDHAIIAASQDTELDQRELRQRLCLAVADLPEAERTVTHLFYFENLAQKDIAAFLEVPLTTVKYRLHSSKQQLKQDLQLDEEFAHMVDTTPQEDTSELASHVQEMLQAIECLHEEFSTSLQGILSESLACDVQVRVDKVEQTTFAGFIELLPNPSCTYHYRMTPLQGRVVMHFQTELACAMAGHDSPGPMTLPELVLVVPTLTKLFRSLDAAWQGVVQATELELDTDPRWLLADFEERGVAQNTAVATELVVTAGALQTAMHICYDAADLERILPHLQDGAQATQSLEPAPAPLPAPSTTRLDVRIVKATAETGYIIENMIPLHHHDQPPEVSFRTNRHGVPMLDPRAKSLKDFSAASMRGWWDRPQVYLPMLVMADDVPLGYALVEAPPVAPDGVQFYLSAFFLHRPYRGGMSIRTGVMEGTDVADSALRQLFDRHRGEWEINTCIGNHEQQDMFHRVLSSYVPGKYRAGLGVGSLYGTSMMGFRFNNADRD